ncbi:molybdate ABC transporter substrate-binding protein [Sulfidibacter corallicola]|uniref:Molybdate ABC transporter substrate-binding protein n=1 Tax=Sulfidibacter corallicola TaxID=2818388 RepID=A0A8A4TXC9_SULCO|nr:molybdate ABC transporter substrate-binding protein [Sulfidibacter corallicola]QTD53858.1 molybdate ABC transporter substrate-binding protein [Sulfidibacter corallicola]
MFLVVGCPWILAGEIKVAVASNFTAPMKEIAAAFERSSGHRVTLSFGSSGKFFAQIKHGAPFQVFFSADRAKPEALEKAGLVVPESRFTYAVGALALWSVRPGYVDDDSARLKKGDFRKLALANPKLAPYGMAAVEVLQNLKLKEATQAKWVYGENISQTYQFVGSGNAELGFVAVSQIMDKGRIAKGFAWIVPGELHDPIRQDAVLLKRGAHSDAARALLHFVRGEKAAQILQSYGYKTLADVN